MTQFYNYLHCKPNGEPFYVGKGKRNRCREFAKRSVRHKNEVAKHGVENIKVWVFPCESEKEAFAIEIQWIAQLRKEGYSLVNISDGGEGPTGVKHTDEFKRKVSARHTGKVNSEETRAKMSKAKRGVPRPPRTAEHNAKVSTAMMGHSCSDETRRKIAATKVGKKRPPEVVAKMVANRKSQKGIPRDPEVVARIMETKRKNGTVSALKGRPSPLKGKPSPLKGRTIPPHSAEHRQKLSEAMTAHWASKKTVS